MKGMRRAALVAVVLLAVGSTACGSDHPDRCEQVVLPSSEGAKVIADGTVVLAEPRLRAEVIADLEKGDKFDHLGFILCVESHNFLVVRLNETAERDESRTGFIVMLGYTSVDSVQRRAARTLAPRVGI